MVTASKTKTKTAVKTKNATGGYLVLLEIAVGIIHGVNRQPGNRGNDACLTFQYLQNLFWARNNMEGKNTGVFAPRHSVCVTWVEEAVCTRS